MSAAEWIAQRRTALGLLSAYEGLREMAGDLTAAVAVGSLGIRGADITAAEDDARTSLPRALDALEAVLALHRKREWIVGLNSCDHCRVDWPCPTVTAIETALRGES